MPPHDEEVLMVRVTLLRSAVFSIALIAPISPAFADAVTLVCQVESGEPAGSFTLHVDYDRRTVGFSRRPDGTVQYSAAATITEAAVVWKAAIAGTDRDTGALWFEGSLNRLSGKGTVNFPKELGFGFIMTGASGSCRRATQKF